MKRRRKGGGDDLTYKPSRNSLKNELIFVEEGKMPEGSPENQGFGALAYISITPRARCTV